MKTFRNNWENYSEIKEIPSEMAVGAVSKALERAVGDRGSKVFELSNHLGNVLATVSDKKLGRVLDSTSVVAAYYEGQVQSVQDYYAFGWGIPSRSFSADNYRYGYQGSEKNLEVNNGSYTTKFRQLDTRIGRWFSIDPVVQANQSPYCSMDNSPTLNSDPLGDIIRVKREKRKRRDKTTITYTGVIIDRTGSLTGKELRQYRNTIRRQIRRTYRGKDKNTKWSIDVDLRIASTTKEIGIDDNIISLEYLDDLGQTGFAENGFEARVSITDEAGKRRPLKSKNGIGHTATHEVGHNLGLPHLTPSFIN